jgi:RNA polymerase sigma-70 factor (ECF subfamily)
LLRALGLLADQPEPIAADPSDELERARAAAAVRAVLDRLPFKQREVFVMYELEELDGAAIAELIGIPVGTVWTRLHHARKRFEELMRKRIAKEARP